MLIRRLNVLRRAVSISLLAVAFVVPASGQEVPAPRFYQLPRLLDAMGTLRHFRDCPTRNALPMPGGKWNVGARHLHALTFASAGAARMTTRAPDPPADAPMAAEHQ